MDPWLIHVNVLQNPLQYCKVISLQIIKKKRKKKERGVIQGSINSWEERGVNECKGMKPSWKASSRSRNVSTMFPSILRLWAPQSDNQTQLISFHVIKKDE